VSGFSGTRPGPPEGGPYRRAFTLVAAICLLTSPAIAQSRFQTLGASKCVNCHDHDPEKLWWEKKDGPPPNGHINGLNQMENRKTPEYAKAVGLKDAYDPKGSCVRCHATVFKGEAQQGVSCESCHGPGEGYLEPHKEKGAYQKAVALGMRDVVKKPEAWARDCIACHVMDDKRLVDSGHPSGNDFDLGKKFGVVALHWKNKYDAGTIAGLGRAAAAPLIAKQRGGAAAPTAAAAAPATAPPAGATAPSTAAPAAPAPTTPPIPAPAAPAAAPVAAATPPRPTTPAPAAGSAPSTAPASAPPAAPRLPRTPAPPVAAPVINDRTGAAVPEPVPPQPPPIPKSPAALVAEVQGRAIALLDALLRREARTPVRVTPPPRTTPYRGADAELLRLQEEVLALALEALGTAPAKAAPQPK
jgi:hypothetical protein